jgi:hypothetical protein
MVAGTSGYLDWWYFGARETSARGKRKGRGSDLMAYPHRRSTAVARICLARRRRCTGGRVPGGGGVLRGGRGWGGRMR